MRLTDWYRSPFVRAYRRRFKAKQIPRVREIDALQEYVAADPSRYKGLRIKHGMTRDECTATIKQWAKINRGKQQ